jgi:chaperonin cofactor prefoldin
MLFFKIRVFSSSVKSAQLYGSEISKVATEISKVATEISKVATEISKVATEISKVATQTKNELQTSVKRHLRRK